MPAPYHEDVRKQAVELFGKHGVDVASEATGVSRGTIRGWARKRGVPSPSVGTRNSARINYTAAERMRVNNILFERVEEYIRTHPDMKPADMQKLALSYAILTDKRRTEEGHQQGTPVMDAEAIRKALEEAADNVKQLRPAKSKAK